MKTSAANLPAQALSGPSGDYAAKQIALAAQIAELKAVLKNHAHEQKNRPANWGYNGDLAEVSSQLADILTFLNGE